MPEAVNLAYAIGLPPEKAVAYFESKGYKITWDWREQWQQAHARAFTVAGVTKIDVLQDIRAAVDDMLKTGGTLADFEKQLKPVLQRKGWWGKDAQVDKATGEVLGKGLTPYRLKTIYQTNMQTAYMAGRYQSMMENVQDRPLWEYVAVLDGRTRPSHRALDGKVFRYDDPFWDSFYPPNGFNCRCRVRARNKEDLRASGTYLSNGYGRMEDVQVPVSPRKSTETVKVTGYRDPVSGKLFKPDAGWSYHIGKSASASLNQVSVQKLDAAAPTVQKAFIREQVTGKSFAEFYKKPDGNFPMAILSEDDASKIGAKTTVAALSSETMQKQLREHPEVAAFEYAIIQDVIEQGTRVQDSPTSLIYVLQEKGYVTVVKATVSGKALFVTSLRRLSADEAKRSREIQRILKKEKADGGASQPAKGGNPT